MLIKTSSIGSLAFGNSELMEGILLNHELKHNRVSAQDSAAVRWAKRRWITPILPGWRGVFTGSSPVKVMLLGHDKCRSSPAGGQEGSNPDGYESLDKGSEPWQLLWTECFFPPPNIHMLTSNPEWDHVWRWGSLQGNGVMEVEGALMSGISAMIRRAQRASSSFFQNVKIQQGASSLQPKRGSHHTPTMRTPRSRTASLGNCEKSMLFCLFRRHWVMGFS